MVEKENRTVGGNDGAAGEYELAGRGSDSSDNASSFNTQRDDVGISASHATPKHVSVAADFLEKLRPGGPWLLVAIHAEGKAALIFKLATSAEEVDLFVKRYNTIRNLYYHVNRTREGFEGKAKKTHIAAIEYVYADCDPNDNETPEAAKARYLSAVDSARFPRPTAIVDSGNGVQFLWRLEQRIELPDPVSKVDNEGKPSLDERGKPTYTLSDQAAAIVDKVEAFIKAILLALGADPGTQDICRVLRLPGTINLPNAAKKKKNRVECPATLLDFNDSVHALSAFPLPAPNSASKGGTRGATRPTAATHGSTASKSGETFPLGIAQLNVSDRIKEMIATGMDPKEADLPPEQRRTRSQYVFGVLTELVRAGYKSNEYECFFLDQTYPISAHVLEQKPTPRQYFEKNVENAEKAVAEEKARGVEAEIADAVAKLNEDHCVARWGGSGVVVKRELVEGRFVYSKMTPATLKLLHATPKFIKGFGRNAKEVGLGEMWLDDENRRTYLNGVTFYPSNKEQREGVLNLWQGFAYKPKEGDWGLLRDHLFTIVCNKKQIHFDYLMNWMARMFQFPELPGEVAVVLRGKKGSGKGTLGWVLAQLLGVHGMSVVDAQQLVGRFNGHLALCVFLFADEAFYAGDTEHLGVLNALITEEWRNCEFKGLDIIQIRNFLHILMASNSDWVVPASDDERRYFMLDVVPARIGDRAYFTAIRAQLKDKGGFEAMLYEFLNRDISSFDVSNVPDTDALHDQKKQTFKPEYRWWHDVLMRGYVFESEKRLEKVFSKWSKKLTTELLWKSYFKYMKDFNRGKPLSREYLGRFLRKMGEQIQLTQGVIGEVEGWTGKPTPIRHEGRAPSYELGSLKDARETFDKVARVKTDWEKVEVEEVKELTFNVAEIEAGQPF